MDTIKVWLIWFWTFLIAPQFVGHNKTFFNGAIKAEFLKGPPNSLSLLFRDPGHYTVSYFDPDRFTGADDPIDLYEVTVTETVAHTFEIEPNWISLIIRQGTESETLDLAV